MQFQKLLVCALMSGCVSAVAAPVTFSFTGVVTSSYDYDKEAVGALNGMAFKGSYTVDLASAEEPWRMLSQSGCNVQLAGACTSYYGTDAPVITDWTVQVGGVTWGRLQDDFPYSSTQSVASTSMKQVFSGQSSSMRTGDPGTLVNMALSMNISASNLAPDSFSGEHLEAPDLGQAGSTYVSFINYGYSCRFAQGICQSSLLYTGGGFEGYLTSWDVAEATEVPEPGSLALLGVGVAGLMAVRKRKQASS